MTKIKMCGDKKRVSTKTQLRMRRALIALFTLFLLGGGMLPLTTNTVAYDGSESHLWLIPQGGTIYTNTTFYIYLYLNATDRTGSAIVDNITFTSGNCTSTYYIDASYFFGSSPFYDTPSINNASNYISGFQIGEDDYAGVGNGHTGNETMIRYTFNVSTPGSWDINISGTTDVYDENGTGMGCTRHNRTITINTPSPPGIPTSVTATNYSTNVYLAYSKAANSSHVYIEGSSTLLSPWNRTDGGTLTTTTNNYYNATAQAGHLNHYKLWGYNTTSGLYSTTGVYINGTTYPGQPTGVSANGLSGAINVSFTTGVGATHTYVEWHTSADGTWEPGDHTNGTLTTNEYWNHTGLGDGTTRYYKVWGYNASSGYSLTGATTDATTEEPGAPSPPTDFTASTHNTTVINLSWNNAVGSNLKTVIAGKKGGYPDRAADEIYNETIATGTTYQHDSLDSSSTYYYRAWTYNTSSGLFSSSYDSDSANTASPTGNQAPDEPTRNSPGTLVSYAINFTLNVTVSDPDGDTLNVTFFGWNVTHSVWDNMSYQTGKANGSYVTYVWSNVVNSDYDYFPDEADLHTFSWTVGASDGEYETYFSSSQQIVITQNTTPGVPTYPLPENGSTGIPHHVNISCLVVDPSGDTMDVLFINNDTGDIIKTPYSSHTTNVSSGTRAWAWIDVSENTTLNWYARSWDGSSWSENSSVWSFTTLPVTPGYYAPNKPERPYPANGEMNVPPHPILSVYVSYPDDHSPDPSGDPPLVVRFYGNISGSTRELIGTQYITGNQWVTQNWWNRANGTSYSWNVSVSTDIYTVEGDVWEFTTKPTGEADVRFFIYTIQNSAKVAIQYVNVSYRPSNTTSIEGYATTDDKGKCDINISSTVATPYTFVFNPPQPYSMQTRSFVVTPDVGDYVEVLMYSWDETEIIMVSITCYDGHTGDPLSNVTATVVGYYQPLESPYYGDSTLSTIYIRYPKPDIATTHIAAPKVHVILSKNWNGSEDANATQYTNYTLYELMLSGHYNVDLMVHGFRPDTDPHSTNALDLGVGSLTPYFGSAENAKMVLCMVIYVIALIIMNMSRQIKVPMPAQLFILVILTGVLTAFGWMPPALLLLAAIVMSILGAMYLKNIFGSGGGTEQGNGGVI